MAAAAAASIYQCKKNRGHISDVAPPPPLPPDAEPPACNSRQSPEVSEARESLHDNREREEGNAEEEGGGGEW